MANTLKVKKIGIDTYHENIAYMPRGCEICKSQGFHALSKIEIHHNSQNILATLNMTENGMVSPGEIGLSRIAFERLGAKEGDEVRLSHPNPLLSTEWVRKKLEGQSLSKDHFLEIVRDILKYRYSNIELTAFVIACSQQRLNEEEIRSLTEVMIETGEQIEVNTGDRTTRARFSDLAERQEIELLRTLRRNNIDTIALRTGDDYLPALRSFFKQRERRLAIR
jgi:thymidine phosphorylase